MIIYSNTHVEIKYHPSNDNTSYLRDIYCCDISKKHIPFYLYIRVSRTDISAPNVSNILSHTPTYKDVWLIDIEKYVFKFAQKEVAMQYFEMFAHFDETKTVQELLPELFL